jgi:hypothetical protein
LSMLYVLRFIGDVFYYVVCFTFYWWRFVFVVCSTFYLWRFFFVVCFTFYSNKT